MDKSGFVQLGRLLQEPRQITLRTIATAHKTAQVDGGGTVIPEDLDALLTRKATAEALNKAGFPISDKTLATQATRGGGPPYQKFGPRVLYRWGDALAWAQAKLSPPIRSTAELNVVELEEADHRRRRDRHADDHHDNHRVAAADAGGQHDDRSDDDVGGQHDDPVLDAGRHVAGRHRPRRSVCSEEILPAG